MIKSGELEISFSSQHTHILDCAHTHINAEMQRMLRYALSLVSANQSEPASSDACHKNTLVSLIIINIYSTYFKHQYYIVVK